MAATVVWPESPSAQEETFSARAMFYYMKEWHYPRALAVGGDSYPHWGGVPKNDPNFDTVNGVWDSGIDGLVKKVNSVLLGLPFEQFGTHFSVNYIPEWKEKYSDQILAWGIDIDGKDVQTVIWIVRDLVNAKLAG